VQVIAGNHKTARSVVQQQNKEKKKKTSLEFTEGMSLANIGRNYEVQTNRKRKPRMIFGSRSHMISRFSVTIQIITILKVLTRVFLAAW
jgi:hypothetical protein